MNKELYDIRVTEMNGRSFKLGELAGKVLLIVNVASKCGLAEKGYQELATLLVKFYSRGLRVLIFPCRQFLNQEFVEREKIMAFAAEFSDKFTLMDVVEVKGPQIHPLFKYLTEHLEGFLTNSIKWNFTYFLVGREGELVRRYGPTERLGVDDKDLLKCIGNAKADVENVKPSGHVKVEFEDSD